MSGSADAAVGVDAQTASSRTGPLKAFPNRPAERVDRSAPAGWLAIVAVLLWPGAEAIRIVSRPVHEVVYGDYALFELASRRAWGLRQLLGPHAHPGFHHPGPAMFYLLAPTVRLLEPAPGLYFGTVLINAAALTATVAFIWRCQGSRAALWTAITLNAFCLALTLDTLRQPWNSLLIIVPMFLFVALWAGSVTGVAGAWVWAAVVGSYEIQTHITAALFVTVMLSLAGLWALARTRRRAAPRRSRGWWHRPGRVTGGLALALIWLPSTIELFRDHPNNLTEVVHYFRYGHNQGIAVSTSLGIVLRSVVISPFNHRVSPQLQSLTWWTVPLPASRIKEVAACLILGAGALLIGWLVHRQQRFAAALAIAPMLAVPLATFTVSHAGADNYAFLTGWLAFVPYALLLALGIGLLTPRPRPNGAATTTWPSVARSRHPALHLTALAAVVALSSAGVTVISDLRSRSVASVARAVGGLSSFAADAEAQLKPGDRWVAIQIASDANWEIAANVVLELERRGYHTVVDPRYASLFGEAPMVHPVQVGFAFYMTSDPAGARVAQGHIVSTAGGNVMTSWRPPT